MKPRLRYCCGVALLVGCLSLVGGCDLLALLFPDIVIPECLLDGDCQAGEFCNTAGMCEALACVEEGGACDLLGALCCEGLVCGNSDVCEQPAPEDFNNASAARGGALYDKYWAVSGVGAAAPTEDHPFWSQQTTNTRMGADTWRCKECHGWDYKGVDGAYATGSHMTGFAGIYPASMSAQDTFDLIKTDHGYGAAGLSDADIWDLAKFVLEGLIDTDDVIGGDSTFTGDDANGQTLYEGGINGNTACMICHGVDGLTVPPGAPADFSEWVGLLADENPWEFLHKVRFGQPGTAMPAAASVDATLDDLADLGAYAQSLPNGPTE